MAVAQSAQTMSEQSESNGGPGGHFVCAQCDTCFFVIENPRQTPHTDVLWGCSTTEVNNSTNSLKLKYAKMAVARSAQTMSEQSESNGGPGGT